MTKLKIVGLGGSLGKVSLEPCRARDGARRRGGGGRRHELLDLRELDLPMYDPDDES